MSIWSAPANKQYFSGTVITMTNRNELEARRSGLTDQQRQLLEQWKQGSKRQRLTIESRPKEADILLSPAQRRLWFLDQLLADKSAYNMYFAVRLSGEIDTQAVYNAFQFVMERHESLRINFTNQDGSPRIVLRTAEYFAFSLEDLTGLPVVEAMDQADQLLETMITDPFELAVDPLLRVRLICLHPQEYILALCMHHIISDGWSMGILVKEWVASYTASAGGEIPRLAPLTTQYSDYAYWQNEQLGAGKMNKHLNYWTKKLAQCPSVALLPDRKSAGASRNRGGEIVFDLPAELTRSLRAFCAEMDTTLFMALFTMFGAAMYRYTREQTIVIGTPIANRNYTEIEGIIGYFVNLLPLRLDIEPEMTAKDLLKQVVKTATEAYDHQNFPFDRVIEELQPDRQGWAIPLVRNLFVFQNTPAVNLQLPHVQTEMIRLHNGTSKSDMLLSMADMDGRLSGRIEYDTDLFTPNTMQNFADHFIQLMQSALAQPEVPLARLSLLAEQDRRSLLLQSQAQQPTAYPLSSLHRQFERIAALYPDHPALTWQEKNWTYSELNAFANRLARYLLDSGAAQGSFIAICMSRSPYLIASILAVLKAGCAYVPIDPTVPAERIRWMLQDADCLLLLSDHTTAELLPTGNWKQLEVLPEALCSADDASHNLSLAVNEDDVAYMIYTSGSTGLPKGVLVEHGSVSRLFATTQPLFKFNEQDVWTLYHSYAFDFSVWEIWGALLQGGRLVIVSAETTRSFDDFYRLLVRERVTILNQTPSAFKQLIHAEQHLGRVENPNLALRYIIFGGEALELQSLRPWFEAHGDACPQLINMYGITEITVHATYRPLSMLDLKQKLGSVIGVPLPDMEIYILDDNQDPVPVGLIGEMYIGGRGVARGYWKREELNRERFIVNPFGTDIGKEQRLYRSGDLARWTTEGELEYWGRRDEQVKIRGYRIELGEVEAVVGAHKLVSQNVAVVDHNEQGDAKIICYLIPNKHQLHTLDVWPQLTQELVDRWETVFDSYYMKENEHNNKTFHIVGWNDSFQGLPIPEVEMEEWTEETVKRILKYKPRRVLEIGCGTGLLLFRIAPYCEAYIGTDLSEKAIDYVSSQLHILGDASDRVRLFKCNAHELPDLEQVDMIVINSVVQYFPDLSYLDTVLQQCVGRVKPGGCIFIGDICGLMFREAFHCSVVMQGIDEKTPMLEFNRMVQRKMKQHAELMLDSSYFIELKQHNSSVYAIEMLYKQGKYQNEMSKFRYDAVLHLGDGQEIWEPTAHYIWNAEIGAGLQSGEFCMQHQNTCFIVTGVPNGRVAEEWNFLQWHKQAASKALIQDYFTYRQQTSELQLGIDPAVMLQWGGESHQVEVLLSDAVHTGGVDVLFAPRHTKKITPFLYSQGGAASKQCSGKSSIPMQHEIENKLIADIQAAVRNQLPDYMMPAQFVVLEQFPLTSNGKIERSKLRELKPSRLQADISPEAHSSLTETELALRGMWQSLLDVDHVELEDNFFEIGGHSLLVSQMMFQIKKQFHVQIPLMQLMLNPTIRSIAQQIDSAGPQGTVLVQLNLASKVHLAPDIQTRGMSLAVQTNGKPAILLTGATGFFGVFLLHELLQESNTDVYCLVRAATNELGLDRIISGMKKYSLWNEEYGCRIKVVIGDLAADQFGLDDESYDDLTRRITAIYHNGATVNFAQSYMSLEGANVKGSASVLKLASTYNIKPVHFISTLYVFSEKDAQHKKIILEEDVPTCYDALKLGYTQSKWVAEGLMMEGRRRGIPVNIYRLGRISGDSRTGACQDHDFFWKIIRFCLQLGAFPKINFRFNLIPADFAGSLIVQLASNPLTTNHTYHIMNDHECSFQDIILILTNMGYKFEQLPWEDWKLQVEQVLETDKAHSVDISLIPFIEELSMIGGEAPVFSASRAFAYISTSNMTCPLIDTDRLTSYINYFIASGYFEPIIR
ncbi:non-ribosomal peptide synthetase [Paenibacillus sp. UMB4589-SE434]|uniref:non-ribosomal peptide synthetase n=1 Tax=Paenibacillus sp. UMB4589-SE434 TaxID=3046314 RepID=UPI002550F594|nr:non-ribosomal peptide synthetase [Paenibacillus sp. UMB4589-SE434]MDK8182711.1 amino acid adenylation domain-containing protein [Paenibacillus sp. UMB4589-SE434]